MAMYFLMVVVYYGGTGVITSERFEVGSFENCMEQSKHVKEIMKLEGYTVATVCIKR